MLMPGAALPGAARLAERFRAAVAATPISVGDGSVRVTISGGCALGPRDRADDLIREADLRLYEAKRSGRNRIIVPTAKP